MRVARTYVGTANCANCGESFPLRADAAKKANRGKYCGTRCSNAGRSMPLTADFALVKEMYVEQRKTTREIAETLGTTWKRVSLALKENGIPLYHHRRAAKRSSSTTYRKVAQETHGKPLTAADIVHHLNCDPRDNRPENLVVVSKRKHSELHKQLETISARLFTAGLITWDCRSGYRLTNKLMKIVEG